MVSRIDLAALTLTVGKKVAMSAHRLSGSKTITQKIKLHIVVFLSSVSVAAINNLLLGGMQFQFQFPFGKTLAYFPNHTLRILFGFAMHDTIIGVPLSHSGLTHEIFLDKSGKN